MTEYCRYARAQALLSEGQYSDALRVAGPILEHQPGSSPAWYQVALAAAHLKPGEAAQKNLENASFSLARGLFPLQALSAFHNALLPGEIRERLIAELAARYSADNNPGQSRPLPATFARGDIAPWNAELTSSEIVQMAESLCALSWANSLESLQLCPESCEMPLFSWLSATAFIQLTRASRVRQINAGEVILPAGKRSSAIYIIIYGTAHSQLDVGLGRRVHHSRFENDLLGEESIVTGTNESADIVATEPCTLLELPIPLLEEISRRESGGARFLARYYQRRMLTILLRENPLLAALPLAERGSLLKEMTPIVCKTGSPLFTSSPPLPTGPNIIGNTGEGTDCILVFSGKVLSSSSSLMTDNDSRDDNAHVFSRGDWVDLEKWRDTAASQPFLRAMENTVALKLSRNEFRAIISRYPKATEAVYPLQEGN